MFLLSSIRVHGFNHFERNAGGQMLLHKYFSSLNFIVFPTPLLAKRSHIAKFRNSSKRLYKKKERKKNGLEYRKTKINRGHHCN